MVKINAGIVALIFKIGSKLLTVAIKLTKFLKIGKAGLAVGSMISYAYLFTWQFALMIMVLLLVHEYGHIWAMKRCGLKTKGIYFIPFLGAAAVTDEMFKSRKDEAYIAIMGPIFGLALSGVAAIIYIMTNDALFAAAAGWMAMVNLFNLLPINPLDGGRIMKSITFSINSRFGLSFLIIGIIASMILTFWAGIILFFILLIIASLDLVFEYKMRNEKEVINRCIKELDKFTGENPPDEVKHVVNKLRNILTNEKEDPSVRINTILAAGKKFHGDISKEPDYEFIILSYVMSPTLENFNPIPKMTVGGIVMTAMVYIGTSAILWLLMTYMNNIPEVEIARKFFMS